MAEVPDLREIHNWPTSRIESRLSSTGLSGYEIPEVKPPSTIWFCRIISRYPGFSFALLFAAQTSLLLITGLAHLLGDGSSDVFPADFTDVPLILESDPSYQRIVAWNLRNSDPNEPIVPLFRDSTAARQVPADITELLYKTSDGSNILTRDHLKAILEFENELLMAKDFKKFCVIQDQQCLPTRSLPRVLEEFIYENSTDDNSTNSDERMHQVILSLKEDQKSHEPLMDFMDKGARVDEHKVFATALRSYVYISWAIDNATGTGYNTRNFASDILHPYLYNAAQGVSGLAPSHDNIDFFYYNEFLYFDYLSIQVIHDLYLVAGSFSFIFGEPK